MEEWSKSDPRMRSYTLAGQTYNYNGVFEGQPAPVKASPPSDLLREFDLGMDRVRGWNITDDEGLTSWPQCPRAII